MGSDKEKIGEFWDWFEVNEQNLVPKKISDDLISKLDRKILSMGDFSWEIREGIIEDYMLIISPGGDVDLLPNTKFIIELAPKIEGWEFCHYKPSKKWDYQLTLYEESNVKRILDVKDWEYVLYKFPDETFDIILKAKNLKSSSEKENIVIGDIVLESILGEERSLKLIKNIEFVDEFDDTDRKNKNSIKFLKEHFEKLL